MNTNALRSLALPLILCAGAIARPAPARSADNALPPLAKLKDHFVGRVSIDKKSGELTLHYDFRFPRQLDDFKPVEGKAVCAKGVLGLEGASTLQHRVRWKTVKVSCVAHVVEMRGDILSGNKDVRISTGGDNPDTVYFLDKHVLVDGSVRRGEIPVGLEIDETRGACQWGKHRLATKAPSASTIQVELAGMQQGCGFSQLVIRGLPDPDWLTEAFGDEIEKKK